MTGEPASPIPPEVIDRRLRELFDLYEFGKVLREIRFLDEPPPDRVRERPEEAK